MTFGQNILILVPHPDDEVVGFAAAIGRATQQGSRVYALYLTHGCIAQQIRWPWDKPHHSTHLSKRRAEAEKVAEFLNLAPAGWSDRAARFVWQDLPTVYDEIAAAIKAHQIDQIWTPAFEGGNADHDAANALASLFSTLSVLEFAEYNFCNGKAHAQAFPFPNGTEEIITLSPEETTAKKKALALYESEQCNLGYVGTAHEAYRPLARHDYSKPPHEGTLWYARFQWVPFRHPRVDFTQPSEVAAKITAFLNSHRT